MAPFNTPWSTFFAWIVTGLSIIIAIVWAFIDFKLSKRKHDNRKKLKQGLKENIRDIK